MKTKSIRVGVATSVFCLGIGLLARAEDAAPQVVSSVLFKEGKVLVPKDDNMVETTNDVLVASLAVVRTNGIFTVKHGKVEGKERQLLEGEHIDEEGMLTSPDGTVVPIVDHLVVRNGRVQLVKDGDPAPLTTEFALPDRSRVTPDGTVRAADGRVKRLLDGQLIKLDGTSLPVTDTVSLQDGKVILYKDGGRIELKRTQFMAMSDGSRVGGDGSVVKPDGTRITLKEGEILKLEGVKTK